MIKKYELTLVEDDLILQGKLDKEILIMISEVEKKKYYFLRTDLTEKGIAEIKSLIEWVKKNSEVRVVCLEKDQKEVSGLLGALNASKLKFATYQRRGDWRFKYTEGKLQFLADEKIKVLIVDDSKTIRSLLEKIFSEDKNLEIVGSLADPSLVEAEIRKLKPDVMTLDIHMPKMTGVEVLRKIMPKTPIPTVMVSSVGIEEGREVLTALELGAVDYMQKPSFDEINSIAPILIEKVKTAASVDVSLKKKEKVKAKINLEDVHLDRRKIICIGSSTGGTEAIRTIFRSMPKKFPPVLITQHIPKLFSLAFAESLKREFMIEVFEAKDGQAVLPNQVLIAPGGLQMEIVPGENGMMKVRVFDGPPVNRHKPSVDVLFHSAAKVVGKHAVGIILTGMGNDGAKGLKAMKEMGSMTFGQDQDTSVVYGMPRVAKEIGAVEVILSIDEIAEAIIEECRLRAAA